MWRWFWRTATVEPQESISIPRVITSYPGAEEDARAAAAGVQAGLDQVRLEDDVVVQKEEVLAPRHADRRVVAGGEAQVDRVAERLLEAGSARRRCPLLEHGLGVVRAPVVHDDQLGPGQPVGPDVGLEAAQEVLE